ncbi:hypothetical protein [Robiginitalea sp. IMCC43444]|uniref:hypothetical protein n=1 Tax=Robiginitalea sp. IMCC43444 TaxID=3459121 RepID=UPI0040421E5D
MKTTFTVLAAALLIIACAEKKEKPAEVAMEEAPSIEGAWEMSHIKWESPDTTVYWKPYKSIIIYTDSFYSEEIAMEDRPSWADLAEGEKRSMDDIKNAYQGFWSNSGRYEIVGDSLVRNIIVAKYPNNMNDNPRRAEHLTIEQDSIYFTLTTEDGVRTMVLKPIN